MTTILKELRNRRRLAQILERLAATFVVLDPTSVRLNLEESATLVAIGVRNTMQASYGEVPDVTSEDVAFFAHLLHRCERAMSQTQVH